VQLKDMYSLCHLSVGDLLRAEVASGSEIGQVANSLMVEGKIVPTEITLKIVRQAIEAAGTGSAGFLIDGFPREINQAIEWERNVRFCMPFFGNPSVAMVVSR
jgi:adenylate kinase family enzyme